jgi:hypothetical protein
MQKQYNFFVPKSGYFPDRLIDFKYDDNNFCFDAVMYDLQGLEIGRKYNVTLNQIQDNIDNGFYIEVPKDFDPSFKATFTKHFIKLDGERLQLIELIDGVFKLRDKNKEVYIDAAKMRRIKFNGNCNEFISIA